LIEGDDTAELDWELRRAVFRRAAAEVGPEFRESTWQAYWKTSVGQKTAEDVANELGLSIGAVQQPDTVPPPAPIQHITPAAGGGRGRKPAARLLKAAGFAFFLLLWSVVLIVLEYGKGTLRIECAADDVPVRIVKGERVVENLIVTRDGRSVRIAAGNYVVEIDGEMDEITVVGGVVQLERGGREVVRIVQAKEPPGGAADRTVDERGQDSHGLPNANQSGSVALVMLMHPAELRNGNTVQLAAASIALGQLNHRDYCGILRHWTNGPSWLWGGDAGLVQIGDRRADLIKTLASSRTGDLPQFDPAFRMALNALKRADAKQRHMIVLTDGDPVLSDSAVLAEFRDAGITISVVHIGLHGTQYEAVPKQIAETTGGRYYHVLDAQPSVVETIFQREAGQIRRSLN
jgi:hypothetical protein